MLASASSGWAGSQAEGCCPWVPGSPFHCPHQARGWGCEAPEPLPDPAAMRPGLPQYGQQSGASLPEARTAGPEQRPPIAQATLTASPKHLLCAGPWALLCSSVIRIECAHLQTSLSVGGVSPVPFYRGGNSLQESDLLRVLLVQATEQISRGTLTHGGSELKGDQGKGRKSCTCGQTHHTLVGPPKKCPCGQQALRCQKERGGQLPLY